MRFKVLCWSLSAGWMAFILACGANPAPSTETTPARATAPTPPRPAPTVARRPLAQHVPPKIEPRDRFLPVSVATIRDEFTGSVSHRLTAGNMSRGMGSWSVTTISGDLFGFAFLTSTPAETGWRYLTCHRTNMLVDGRPFLLPEADHDGTIGRSSVTETVSFFLSREQVMELLPAMEIKIRVCTDVFTLPLETGTRLSDLVSRSTQGASE